MANENEKENDELSFMQRMLKGKTTKFFLTLAALYLLSKVDFTKIPSNLGLTSGEKQEQSYDNGANAGSKDMGVYKQDSGIYVKLGQQVHRIEVEGETYKKNMDGLTQLGRRIYSVIPQRDFVAEMNYHVARIPTDQFTKENAARIATEAIDGGNVFSAYGYKTLGDRCHELYNKMEGQNGNP